MKEQFFRIVHGAIRNTRHAHPEYGIGSTASISIAKRASGLLSAYWRERVPARPAGSGDGGQTTSPPAHKDTYARRGRAYAARPLRRLRQDLTRQMTGWKHTESPDYVRTMIDVLRLIDRIDK